MIFDEKRDVARCCSLIIQTKHQLVVTLIAVGLFIPLAAVAGELNDQDQHSATQQVDEETKIQIQTLYLAAKFGQRESTIREYVELAWDEARNRDGVTPELLIAMMQKESSLRPKVESSYGAQGLMQVVRRWHYDKLHPSESLFDPVVNIRVGADILEEYLEKAGGSLWLALRRYSGNAQGYAKTVMNESYKLAHVAAEAAGQALASKG
jgi:soluble lytic murein transglycosylase-like protein